MVTSLTALTKGAPAAVTAFSPTLPAHVTGDRLILLVLGKYDTTTVPTIDQGWTLLRSGTGGTGAQGVDTGLTFFAVYGKDATSSSETAPTVTPGGTAPNSWVWICVGHRPDSGFTWRDAIATSAAWVTSANDTSTAAALSGTCGAWTGVQPTAGDAIFTAGVEPGTSGTDLNSGSTVTCTGLSGGTLDKTTTNIQTNALNDNVFAAWMSWVNFTGTASAGLAVSIFSTGMAATQSGCLIGISLRQIAVPAVPFTAPRRIQSRDPDETYWNQKDRRNANLVSTAADPLVAPLDSAWQAGGRYWHRYNDWTDRRFYPQQRSYTDVSLLTPVVADPLLLSDARTRELAPAAFVDRRLVPSQPLRESPPGLLDTALLEDPLLSGGDLDKRINMPATHADRRLVPWQRTAISGPDTVVVDVPGPIPAVPWRRDPIALQQRQLESPPDLLSTALLENELLGGADTVKRTNVPATHVDRRLVPQYTLRESPPDLLDSALYEVPGGVSDLVVLATATHLRPGWLRQKLVQADQSAGPDFDPTLAGVEVQVWRRDPYPPTQRSYLTPGLFDLDPTLAGYGTAWRWRRDPYTPQQRQALIDVSVQPPPDLDPTLTGYELPPWRRDSYPAQQRQAFADIAVPLIDADPTLLGWLTLWLADNRAATHVDRRPVPAQRPYISDPSTYPTVAPADPLTVAWGVGGPLWHLYNDSALRDRREVPQQRSYWVEIPAETDPLLSGWSSSWRTRNVAPYISGRLVPQQPKRESDPNLLLTALVEDVLLGGADDLVRHRTWHTSRRLIPLQRPALSLADLPADPLLIVGGDWRRKLTPATHAPRWVLRPWWQQLQFQGGALVLFQGVIVGGVLAGPGATGGTRSGPAATGAARTGSGMTGGFKAGPGETGEERDGTDLTGGIR